ncbi:hypothetical protein QDZ09_001038 [Salmonella enterica]|nr:hypothetical protein [Salmonella enterica]EKT3169385.1 hypothetical protein [Salmonella enterica]
MSVESRLDSQRSLVLLAGNWCGLNRTRQQGGDKFVIGDETWLVVEVPEIWPDWTRVIVCLQV